MAERIRFQAAVFVVGNAAFDLGERQVFANAFRDTDDAAFFAELDALFDGVGDTADEFVEQNDLTFLRIAVFVNEQFASLRAVGVFRAHQFRFIDDVFQTNAQGGFAGDGGTVGKPRGFTAHQLSDIVAVGRRGVEEQVAQLARHEINGREETEREVDAFVVIVDRLRQVDDADLLRVGTERILVELEFRSSRERVVAADGDQDVDAQRAECVVDRLHRSGGFGIGEVFRFAHRFARVGSCGTDDDPAFRTAAFQIHFVQTQIGDAFREHITRFVVDQVRIAVQEAVYFDPCAAEAVRGGADDGIG